MFLLNVGYSWGVLSDLEAVKGAVFLASGSSSARFYGRALPHLERVLFDPQLYLIGLDHDESGPTCARLASFPWFGVQGVPEYDPARQGQREWERVIQDRIGNLWTGRLPEDTSEACRAAVKWQLNLGCTHVILPGPPLLEREGEGAELAPWLDLGVAVSEDLDVSQPLLASVVVAEECLSERAFEVHGYLDAVVDQVSSRSGLDGVYIVVLQSRAAHPFVASAEVNRAYMHFCEAFRSAGLTFIVPNFADVFGLFCRGAGGTDFATGPSRPLRRMSLQGFPSEGGGIALPRYYTHSVIAEYLSESDLNVMRDHRLLSRIADRTPVSEPLLAALRSGQSASDLPAWAESRSNTRAALRHFILRMMGEERRVARLSPRDASEHLRNQLETAVANGLLIARRLSGEALRGDVAPAEAWLDIFDLYL